MPSLLERLCGEGMADAGVVIPSVSVLSLQPHDVLVLSVQHRLNAAQREALRAAVGQAVPGRRVLVLEDGMELEVLRMSDECGTPLDSDEKCTGGRVKTWGRWVHKPAGSFIFHGALQPTGPRKNYPWICADKSSLSRNA